MRESFRLLPIVLALLAGAASAETQQPAKIPRIGLLYQGSCTSSVYKALRQGLRDLGYIERQNLLIEERSLENRYERLPDLVADLVRLKVDVILAAGSTELPQAVKNATKMTPIVFVTNDDPVRAGLVTSFPRPGGNMTGFTSLNAELDGKRLELLKETMPQVGTAIKRGAEALTVLEFPMFFQQLSRIADLVAKGRLPTVSAWKELTEAGGLMSYGVDIREMFRRAAAYVDKILKGAKPADLPVERSMRAEFIINLKAANALGIKIPPEVLIRADRVIQ